MNILVLGCGQIGSRHIQSLAAAQHRLKIFAADNSDDSLIRTKTIFDNVVDKNRDIKLIITKDISEIKDQIDIVIIASNARERSKLITNVLDNLNPMHIILEKVLFNKIDDYKRFENIFEQRNIKVWVNQYMGYEFKFLSKYLNTNEKFHMKVSGNWGLCCNSVHFIEIFHLLCGRLSLNIQDYTLSNEYKKSKRDGYYELFGEINIGSSQSNKLTLECNPEEVELVKIIEINSESYELKDVWADEHHNCNIITKDGKTFSERHYSRRQSERTLEVIESLIKTNSCNLPSYRHSSYHHLLIMNQFKNKFIELGVDINNGVPIT
jgi:hypothetical protein